MSRAVRLDVLMITIVVFGLFAPACASSTSIFVRPAEAEAEVSIDGVEVGPAPIVLREHVWFWSERSIEVSAPGYAPAERKLEAKARPVNLAICALTGCISWLFWPIALQGEYAEGEAVLIELRRDELREADPFAEEEPIGARAEPDRDAVRWNEPSP